MSYDLAVWEGERPSSDAEAAQMHETLYERYVENEDETPPTPLISKFVEELLSRWPDIGVDDDSPWSTAPLIREAVGPYIYFPMAWSRCDEASAFAVEVAQRLGLHCYDPQLDRLRT